MRKDYYTYAYLREDRTPYYIGKGTGYRAYNRSGHRVKPPHNKALILILKRDLTHEEALKHEVYMISVFGRKNNATGILQNLSDGGKGCPGSKRSPEFCQRMSEVHSGKTISTAHKRALRKAHTGKTLTSDHKRKVSESLKGKKRPPRTKEHCKNLSLAAKKRPPISEETRMKMSISAKRSWSNRER